MGRKVMLGLGLWMGRKGDEGIDGGLEDAFEEEKDVAAGDDMLLLSIHQDPSGAATYCITIEPIILSIIMIFPIPIILFWF